MKQVMSLVRDSTFFSVLLFLTVRNVSGLFLRDHQYQVEPNYEDYEDEGAMVVIVINDDIGNEYRNLFLRANDNKDSTTDLNRRKPPSDKLKASQKEVLIAVSVEDNSDGNAIGKGDFDGLKLTRNQKTMLRRKWRASCDKKAAKTCRKACKMAVKNVCRAYRCKRSLRGRFKKECKESCRSKFLGTKAASSDSGSD